MRRKRPTFWLILFALTALAQSQELPEKPLHPNPGRALQLEEVLRIKGEGPKYYFEGVARVEIDREGCLYLSDAWGSSRPSHLLKFAPDGRFLKEFFRPGEGPGEIQSYFQFALTDSDVLLYDFMKRKIVIKSPEGEFRTELKKADYNFGELLGVFDNEPVFHRSKRPAERPTSRLYENTHEAVWITKDGKSERTLASVVNREFIVSLSQGGGFKSWDPFTAVIGSGLLFFNPTQEYLVRILDLKTGKETGVLRRKYPRVKHPTPDWEKKFDSQYNAPSRTYENDIRRLFHDGTRLWICTSTEDKENGGLFDVFDSAGRFIDSVRIKGNVAKIAGDFIFMGASDKDELPSLVKYRIAEPIGGR